MYKLYLSSFVLFLSLLIPVQSKSCIDQSLFAYVLVSYNESFDEVALKITNLNLYGGNPNDFCSCGVTSYTNIYTDIVYVAFVDSGTTNPVAGFDPYIADAMASDAWNDVIQFGDWNGFVSEVNDNGLTPQAPVELIIRAHLPPGYTIDLLSAGIDSTAIGTDEWQFLDGEGFLANSHQNLFFEFDSVTYEMYPDGSNFFDELDADIISSVESIQSQFNIYPNPFVNEIVLELNTMTTERLQIFNSRGALLQEPKFIQGTNRIDLSFLPRGIYFLKLFSTDQQLIRQIVKL